MSFPGDLFDEGFYLSQGAPIDSDPWGHFSTIGWRAGRNPHPLFDVEFYLTQVPDLRAGDLDPLTHFSLLGENATASPHPLFDTRYYVERCGSQLDGLTPLEHFIRSGAELGYDPHPFFSVKRYAKSSPDVIEVGINVLEHFVLYGAAETHRIPHAEFDAVGFSVRHRLDARTNALVEFGRRLFAARERGLPRYVEPDTSIVILNFNKARLTLECLVEIVLATERASVEVVVVDNGSDASEFELLVRYLPKGVKIVRLQENRFFGEGNNIGVEASSGKHVLFLNNDAFINESTLPRLRRVLDEYDDAGAVGPLFRFPDGRIQEAGAMMSSCGTALQRAKFLTELPPYLRQTAPVDYVSAACMLVRRADLDTIAGFDLTFDPAYYEDTDLCLRLRQLGKRTYFCPVASVVHVENATARDPRLGLARIVETNRWKFIERWGEYVSAGADAPRAVAEPGRTAGAAQSGGRRRAVVYTPFPLIPGGGERYLLEIASILTERFETTIVTPERYSAYRLRALGRELQIDLSRVRLDAAAALHEYARCEIFIAIGNELLPSLRAIGKRNYYICQFPYPMQPEFLARCHRNLETYDTTIVYSPYVADHVGQMLHDLDKSSVVNVLPPPCPQYGGGSVERAPGRIVSVGRFSREGHDKRQDAMIAAFRQIFATGIRPDLELHLIGSLPAVASAREHLISLRTSAEGLPVSFHVNASASTVARTYRSSSFYWHATGFEANAIFDPQLHEHFGISVIEAMSAGAIPLVYGTGGPKSSVRDGIDGFHWSTIDQLVAMQTQAFLLDDVAASALRASGVERATAFDVAAFRSRFLTLIEIERSAPNGHPTVRSQPVEA